MEQEKLKSYYKIIESKYLQSVRFENQYKNGKNKKIKSLGLKNLKEEIDDLEYQVRNDPDFLNLIIPSNYADHARSFFWEEFLTVQYFTRDLEDILNRLKSDLANQ